MDSTGQDSPVAVKTKMGRRLIWLTVLGYLFVLLGVGGVMLTHRPEREYGSDGWGDVRASSPMVRAMTFGVTLIGLLVLLSTGGINFRAGRFEHGGFGILTVLVVLLGGGGWYVASHMFGSHWSADSRITAPDGKKYYFLDSNSFKDSPLALGVRRSWNPLYATYEVLGTGPSWDDRAPITIPGGGDEGNRLYINDEGLIVGVHGDKGVFAYDTRAGRFYGRHALKELSPSVLTAPAP